MELTRRDEMMFEWLRAVRLADTDAVRWAMGGLGGRAEPVSMRRAQQWIARGVRAGVLEKGRPAHRDASLIWLSRVLSERPAPNLFRATTRHEAAVAAVSARALAAGWEWSRDRIAHGAAEHQADGVVARLGRQELIEVELTAKTLKRYQTILPAHARRLTEDIARVVYVGTDTATAVVAREANRYLHPALRDRLVTVAAIDERGHLTDSLQGVWERSDDTTVTANEREMPATPPAQETAPARGLPMFGWED